MLLYKLFSVVYAATLMGDDDGLFSGSGRKLGGGDVDVGLDR